MKQKLSQYVDRMMQEVFLEKTQKDELSIEMLDHLSELKKEYLLAGYNEQKAEEQAIKQFGGPNKMLRFYQKKTFLAATSVLVYMLFYYLTYVFTHSWLDITRYTEANFLSLIPPFFTGIYFLCMTKTVDGLGFLFQSVLLPLYVLEKILLPGWTYGMMKGYQGLTFKDLAGFEEQQYIQRLFQGEVGGITFYSTYYLLSSILVLLFVYFLLHKTGELINKIKNLPFLLGLNILLAGTVMFYGVVERKLYAHFATDMKLFIILTIFLVINGIALTVDRLKFIRV